MPMPQPDARAPRPGRRRGQGSQHICEVCSRTFKRTEHLTRHLRTHTKEKPFRCHCGANFTRRDLLTRHWRLTDHTPSDLTALTEADQSLVHQAPTELLLDSPCQDEPGGLPLSFPETQSQGMAEEFGEGDSLTDFQSFFNFIDNVGLSAEWTPENAIFADLGDPQESPQPPAESSVPRASSPDRYGTPFGGWLPSAPAGNENISVIANSNIYAERTTRGTFEITGEQSRSMGTLLEAFRAVVPDFQMPSRHALSRYLTSFFLGFHSHLLFIHRPTYRPSWHPIELTLAMCAAGAQYCFERRIAQELFQASQAITFERIRRGQPNIGPLANAFLPTAGSDSTDNVPTSVAGQWSPLDTIKTLLILVGYATWGDIDLLRMSFNLRVILIRCLRDVGLEEDHEGDSASLSGSATPLWNDWIQRESARRTKLVSFCYINVHSIAYNIYPELWSNELKLRLPCSTQEWQAQTVGQWSRIHRETGAKQMFLHEALNCLLDPSVHLPNDNQPNPSPLGSYILLHALIQRIQIIRELSMANSRDVRNVSSTDIHTISSALRSWTSIWQQAPESGLDPNNENGPVPFTSSALLGIAYVRLSLDIGPLRQFESRQPEVITAALARLLPVERNGTLLSALLYCTHALSIPVRLGVDRVSRSEALFWSVQHALASFECGVFLSKWLCSLDSQAEDVEFTSSKNHILHWVRRIVEEAYCVVDFGPTRLKVPTNTFGLGLAVLKIWSRFFQNNSQWNFVVILGKALEGFSQKLQEDAGSASHTP